MLEIDFKNEQNAVKVGLYMKEMAREAIRLTLRRERYFEPSAVSVVFTDNEGIRKLNAEYRGKDMPTDVLSFPTYDYDYFDEESDDSSVSGADMPDSFRPASDEPVELGDIVISLERAREQAREIGNTLTQEVAFLCVHSTLHLLGYDHEISEEEDALMRKKQREIMNSLMLRYNKRTAKRN
jgi:probable rRNA maturation factor